MVESEGQFAKSGELLCRVCANTMMIAETSQHLALSGAPAWAPDRPDSRSGYWALAPIAFFTLASLLQLLEHFVSPSSCSELGCIGLVLVPMLGIAISLPCAIVAVMKVPAAARRRVAFAAFGAMLLLLGTCVAPI